MNDTDNNESITGKDLIDFDSRVTKILRDFEARMIAAFQSYDEPTTLDRNNAI